MKTAIIIPARYESTRLPGKPLAQIKGRSMISLVYDVAVQSGLGDVFVATDHEDVANEVRSFGGNVAMTHPNLPSGTDRVAVVADSLPVDYRYVVNLQGDMPFIRPEQIQRVLQPLEFYEIGTLVYDMAEEELQNPNSVKAIVSWQFGEVGDAKWFLRASLLYGYHHAGIYAFQRAVLSEVAALEQSSHELAEKLEQLRFLDNGYSIGVVKTDPIAGEINTQEDLDKANN